MGIRAGGFKFPKIKEFICVRLYFILYSTVWLNIVRRCWTDLWGAGASDEAADFGATGEGRRVRDGSGAAARDVAGGGVEAFDRFGEGGIGEAAAGWQGAFVEAGGDADEGGAGVD